VPRPNEVTHLTPSATDTDPRTTSIAESSPQERAAAGKAARAEVPRSSHAEWEPPKDRPNPVELLENQATTRVPELVPIRYGRMLVSPFTFFRGGAAIMASDLASTPDSGLWAQLCGDAHLENFGAFAAPDRSLVFDVNDFDETLPGPWEWDVKRLAASFAIAGRERGFGEAERRSMVLAAVRGYRESMRKLAEEGNLDVWYLRLEVAAALRQFRAEEPNKDVKVAERSIAKARAKDSQRALSKLTHTVDGVHRIISDPPLIVPVEELLPGDQAREADDRLREISDSYRATLSHAHRHLLEGYRYVHGARKVVGVGSVGTRCWIVLLLGRDEQDPLFLQVKEAQHSVLEPYTATSECDHQGQRVVEGQRLTQAASDIFLGWLRTTGLDGEDRDFYVRQLWDGKGSAQVDVATHRSLTVYGQICGSTLARGHARSGDRIAIAAYLGGGEAFDRAIAAFAEAYADQNERDYKAVKDAVEDGKVIAREGL
jgi:uncharacterized protein (DUF2252 family)